MSEEINVLIADDDEIIRNGYAQILNGENGIHVTATATNGVEAVAALTGHIDVALIDINMPVLDGIEAARLIRKSSPKTAIIMLTAFEHEDSLAQSLATGVQGFLTKDTPVNEIANYIKKAYAGQIVYDSRSASILTQSYISKSQVKQHHQDFITAVASLPTHLRPTFRLLLEAKTNKEIAQELEMSPTTIRSYVSDILNHTGCKSRGELAITAVKLEINP